MQDNETQQFLTTLFERAQNGEPTPFQYLLHINEYSFCRKQRTSLKILLKVLHRTEKQIFSAYCKALSTDTADINQLLAYRQLKGIIRFYQTEYDTVDSMLTDYKNYLRAGNFFRALAGETRIITDL